MKIMILRDHVTLKLYKSIFSENSIQLFNRGEINGKRNDFFSW